MRRFAFSLAVLLLDYALMSGLLRAAHDGRGRKHWPFPDDWRTRPTRLFRWASAIRPWTGRSVSGPRRKAEATLKEVLALIKEGKLGDAEKMLAPLEEKAASLPEPLPSKIKAARTALATKKAASAGGISLPGLPK